MQNPPTPTTTGQWVCRGVWWVITTRQQNRVTTASRAQDKVVWIMMWPKNEWIKWPSSPWVNIYIQTDNNAFEGLDSNIRLLSWSQQIWQAPSITAQHHCGSRAVACVHSWFLTCHMSAHVHPPKQPDRHNEPYRTTTDHQLLTMWNVMSTQRTHTFSWFHETLCSRGWIDMTWFTLCLQVCLARLEMYFHPFTPQLQTNLFSCIELEFSLQLCLDTCAPHWLMQSNELRWSWLARFTQSQQHAESSKLFMLSLLW